MSRKRAAIAALIGVIGGAVAGSPYLDDAGACTAAGGNGFQCAMNEAIGPFISAVAIGFCVAILVAHVITVLSRRLLAPAPASVPSTRAATEVDNPVLQIASWGRPPRGRSPEVMEEQPATEVGDGPPADRIRPPSRVGGLGSRGKPIPTPHRVT